MAMTCPCVVGSGDFRSLPANAWARMYTDFSSNDRNAWALMCTQLMEKSSKAKNIEPAGETPSIRQLTKSVLLKALEDGRIEKALETVMSKKSTHGAEELRQLAKKTLLAAGSSGKLEEALFRLPPRSSPTAAEGNPGESHTLRQEAKRCLIEATASGKLTQLLANVKKSPSKPHTEELRQQVKRTFMEASSSGALNTAFAKMRDPSLEDLRRQAKDTLWEATNSGALEKALVIAKKPALKDWARIYEELAAQPATPWARFYKDLAKEDTQALKHWAKLYGELAEEPATPWARFYKDLAKEDTQALKHWAKLYGELAEEPATPWARFYKDLAKEDTQALKHWAKLYGEVAEEPATPWAKFYKDLAKSVQPATAWARFCAEIASTKRISSTTIQGGDFRVLPASAWAVIYSDFAKTPGDARPHEDHKAAVPTEIHSLMMSMNEDIESLSGDMQKGKVSTLPPIGASFRSLKGFLGVSLAAETPGKTCIDEKTKESNPVDMESIMACMKDMEEMIDGVGAVKPQPHDANEESRAFPPTETPGNSSLIDDDSKVSQQADCRLFESYFEDMGKIIGDMGKANGEASSSGLSSEQSSWSMPSAGSAGQIVAEQAQKAREQVQRSIGYMKEKSENLLQVPAQMQKYATEKTESAYEKASAFWRRMEDSTQKTFNMAMGNRKSHATSQHGGA